MTIAELIAKLKEYRQDARVRVYTGHGNSELMDESFLEYYSRDNDLVIVAMP